MSEVERYEFMTPAGEELMHLQRFGSWVRYSDYDNIKQQVKEKNDQWEMCCRDRDALAERVEGLEEQLRLANVDCFNNEADNQRLRGIIEGLPHRYDCRMVNEKLLTGTDKDCTCGAALREASDE